MLNRKAWLYLPGFILLFIFLFVPLMMVLLPTFYDGGLTLSHYREFLMDEYHQRIIWRTLSIALATSLICMVLGVPTAYYMSQVSSRKQKLMMVLCLFPLLTNSVIRNFAWITVLGQKGIINQTLLGLGLIETPLTLLYTPSAIVVGSVYLFLPLMILTVAGVLDHLNDDLLEAAQTLGSNPMKAFWQVVLPLSLPGVLIGTILVFTGTLTAYTTPLLLGGNKNAVIATLLKQQATTLGHWERASVIAVIMIVITLIVNFGLNRFAKSMDRRQG